MADLLEWGTLLNTAIGASAGVVAGYLTGKRKNKAEALNLEQQATRNVLEVVNAELTRFREREESYLRKVNELERQDMQNKLTIHAMEVELTVTRDFLEKQHPARFKFKVFVLDDYQYVLKVLEKSLGKISLIDVHTFETYKDFITALEEKPEILIIDYQIDPRHTAADILDTVESMDGYHPKVIIMSGYPEEKIREKIAPREAWRIFTKDGTYVYQISKEIMDYIKKQTL